MFLSLREPPVRFLWCCIFICQCSSFCCCSSFTFFFSTSSITLPWAIAGFLHPFSTFSPAHRRVFWFATLLFSTIPLSSCRERYVLSGHPQVFFLPYAPSPTFLTCINQGFPRGRQFFIKVCRASYWSSWLKPSPSACLNHSNPQSSTSERFRFKFYRILAWVTCGESLIYELLTRFELLSLDLYRL